MNPYIFHINFYDLAFFGVVFIGLNYISLLWFTKRIQQTANRVLALALSTIVLYIARVLCIDIGLSAYFPHWSSLPLQYILALGH